MAYTTHGWHIPGTTNKPEPDRRARCGGLNICVTCLRSAAAYFTYGDPKREDKISFTLGRKIELVLEKLARDIEILSSSREKDRLNLMTTDEIKDELLSIKTIDNDLAEAIVQRIIREDLYLGRLNG